MADFRRLLFAFALVALLIGVSAPASAAGLTCVGTAQAPLVRGEDYTALSGDIIITCTGGTPTPSGSLVPQVDITVTILNASTITSKITAIDKTGNTQVNFSEALLLVDDPGPYGGAPAVACGSASAPYDSTPNAAPFTCRIQSNDSTGATTYTYTGSRPNVFQARQIAFSAGQAIVFQGVPLDPGPPANSQFAQPTRTLRITNVRFNAAALGIFGTSSSFQEVKMQVNITDQGLGGSQSITVSTATVRGGISVAKGKNLNTEATLANFLQCNATEGQTKDAVVISETFSTFFKTRNKNSLAINGGATYGGTTNWDGADPTQTPDRNSEAGALLGLSNSTGNIAASGKVDQGTRIGVRLSTAPAGAAVSVPNVVYLYSGTTMTGVMVLVKNADSAGAGGDVPTSSSSSAYTKVSDLGSSNLAVYEVLYSNPNAVESATIAVSVKPTKNLTATPSTPEVGPQYTASAGYAPFYVPATTGGPNLAAPDKTKYTAGDSSASSEIDKLNAYPVVRFINDPIGGPAVLFTYSKCACNLLFPWVVGDATFTTSIVVANTSLDPNAGSSDNLNGFTATPMSGAVKFWYYGTAGVSTNPGATPSTQASQTSTAIVPAGGYMAHIVSPGIAGDTSGANGLNKLSGNFAGYVIAQAQFQYCHGVASISANVPGFGTQTYLGLSMDTNAGDSRLSRTIQVTNDAMTH